MNPEDLKWLATNAYHEARGESDEGIKAVCHVVLNRLESKRFPDTIKQVVLQPDQFSWANGGSRPPIKDRKSYERCEILAEEAYLERQSGEYFYGADHYHAARMKKFPSWAKKMDRVTQIGGHIFYKS